MFLSKKKTEKKQPNVFIEIDLDRRRGKRYPEYNFTDLVNEQKRKMNSYSDDEDSRFVDPDAAEIVKRLEARYGNKKSKKTKFHIDDFIDKGQGYDLDDPFVDDTEIYDEYLPSTMNTSKGGFYINRGKLDFKNVNNGDDELPADEKRPSERNNHREERAPIIPNLAREERSRIIPNLAREERNHHKEVRAPRIPNLARVHAISSVTKERNRGR
jgi:ubinuclein